METPKLIPSLLIYGIIGLCIFFLYKFFIEFEFVYLICGTLIPIIAFAVSSQYFGGGIFFSFVLIVSVLGIYFFDYPFTYLFGSFLVYYLMLKIIRCSSGLTGDYLSVRELSNLDNKFLNNFLNSSWYESHKDANPDDLDVNNLINQSFYKESVNPIIDLFIQKYPYYFNNSSYTKVKLLRIHGLGTLHGLPVPIVKNEDGPVSLATQLLLNIFGNIESINKYGVNTDKEELHIQSVYNLKRNSINSYGELSKDELSEFF
ncbi:MAG: hypothetical protein WEA58_02175 [Balneolaceae bacterium]